MPAPAFKPEKLLQTLPLQISDQIGTSIIEGRFGPGERLKETVLANAFDVSRATIREALRLLEQRGLVQIQPQRGAQVTQLSAKELKDLFEVRASLLATGSRLAALQCTPGHVPPLAAHVERLRATVDDLAAYTKASAQLVDLLMVMSGNEVLLGYTRDFALRIGRYVRLGLACADRRRESLATWQRIVDAVAARDADAAEAEHRRLALTNRDAALREFERLDRRVG